MTSALTSSTPTAPRAVSWGRYALVGLGTVVAAVVANVLFYFIAGTVVTYDPQFLPLFGPGGTIIFTIVPAVVAVLLYAVLLRFTRAPERIFTIIAAVGLVISVIPDFTYIPTVPGASVGQTTVLVLMHIVAAGVIVGMLTTLSRPRAR